MQSSMFLELQKMRFLRFCAVNLRSMTLFNSLLAMFKICVRLMANPMFDFCLFSFSGKT